MKTTRTTPPGHPAFRRARRYLAVYLGVILVGLVAEQALAASIGPFEFGFASDALSTLFLFPIRLIGCG